jgi:hypothetical protein
LFFSARSSRGQNETSYQRRFRDDSVEEDLDGDDDESNANGKRRRRFQSAFRIPSTNRFDAGQDSPREQPEADNIDRRPSWDMENNDESAMMWREDTGDYDDADDNVQKQ